MKITQGPYKRLLALSAFIFLIGCAPSFRKEAITRELNQAIADSNPTQVEYLLKRVGDKEGPLQLSGPWWVHRDSCPVDQDIKIDALLVSHGIDGEKANVTPGYYYWYPLEKAINNGCEAAVRSYVQVLGLDQVRRELHMVDLAPLELNGLNCPDRTTTNRIVSFQLALSQAVEKFKCLECLQDQGWHKTHLGSTRVVATTAELEKFLQRDLKIIKACANGELEKSSLFKEAQLQKIIDPACFFIRSIRLFQRTIDRENQVSERSGFVNMRVMHSATAGLIEAEENLRKSESEFMQVAGRPFTVDLCGDKLE